MPQFLRMLVCVLAVLSLAGPVAAQQIQPLAGYRVTAWMEEDGLPPGAVSALAQDADGFLWLGTEAGLVRFDGTRFRTWEELGGAPLPAGGVKALLATQRGALWLALEHRLARLRGRAVEIFEMPKGFAEADVTALVEQPGGSLWAATSAGLLHYSGEQWSSTERSGGDRAVTGLAVDRTGGLYFAINNTIFRVSGDRVDPVAESPRAFQGFAVEAGRAWITDRNSGFLHLGEPGTAIPPVTTRAVSGKGYRLLFDRRGDLWVATYGQGVWQAHIDQNGRVERVQAVTDFQGLSNNVAVAMLEDRSGNIWVGTTAGLNRLAPQRVASVPDLGVVTGVATAGDTLWANASDGLTRLVRVNGEWIARPVSGPPSHPEAMEADRHGALWIGHGSGVERWSVDGTTVRREVVSTALRRVRSITCGINGTVWVFDADQGLFEWRDGRLQRAAGDAALPKGRVAAVYADGHDRLWVSITGQSAVGVIDAQHGLRMYGPSDGYSAGFARSFFEDRDGRLWVAGSLGLARLTGTRFATLKRDARLPVDSLTGVTQDEPGRLWVGTAAGVLRMTAGDVDAALAGRWDSVSAASFDTADGLAGTTGWVGQPSVARTADGRLWFLTVTGLSAIDPAALQDVPPPSPVRVDVVSLDDARVPASDGLRVGAGVSRLQIEFTLPTLSPAEQTRFRYRLDGFDSAWIDSRRLRTAIYTNLPPRDYRFRVQVQNALGVWRAQEAQWVFAVEPAFYQTWWFFALGGIAATTAVWGAWRFRVTRVRQQLAIVHSERARLSRELHDTLLQSLVGVALQCDALANAPDHDSASTGLTQLRRQVEGYVRECRQSLWNLRSPMLEEHDLPTSLERVGSRLAAACGMSFAIQVTGTPRLGKGRIDEQLLRIGQEAIANAARHSGASRIDVTLDYDTDTVRLRVSDDGHGFVVDDPLHAASGHWGLVGMDERARAVQGRLAIESNPRGTRVEVTVPSRQGDA